MSQSYIDRERATEAANAHEKAMRYRDGGELPPLENKRVVVVDDGVATGATARACLRQVREAGAEYVVLAVPVGSPEALAELETDADTVVSLRAPEQFRAVGQYYDDFGQVSDAEAMSYLDDER